MDIHKPKPWHGLREFLKGRPIWVVRVFRRGESEGVGEEIC
jgi:hypothetical protein